MGGDGGAVDPTIPTATPPPTANNAASLAVEQATFRQQLRRKSISSTITPGGGAGAYTAPNAAPGPAPTGAK